ncbi:hypothetical protein DFAR_1240016 [Desulfarculales bacterium]
MLVGTDCPGRDDRLLSRAFQALADHDLVLGPAQERRLLPGESEQADSGHLSGHRLGRIGSFGSNTGSGQPRQPDSTPTGDPAGYQPTR